MIVIIGLVILIAAVVVGVAGVLTNDGGVPLPDQFSVFGYHVTGSTGVLFLYGIVVGAVGVCGFSVLMAGARRTARRGRTARRELKQSRRETVAANQDHNRADARRHGTTQTDAAADTYADMDRGAATDAAEHDDRPGHRYGGLRAFGRRRAERQPVGPVPNDDGE
jgi:uncharacterized membrane protein YciS (DUF1049 family)